jgi:ATP-dependent Clp protease adaptor protein ClpS
MSESVATVDQEVFFRPKAKSRRRETKKARPKTRPPHAVIVENDAVHTWIYVVGVFQKVFGFSKSKSFLLTAKIHFAGESIVWSGTLEVAELKRDQIRGCGPDHHARRPCNFPLGVRIEKLPG